MEFEIIKEKENILFNRKEIQIKLEAQITPSKNEMFEAIAQKFSSQPENISLKGIHGKFGTKEFIVNANIYSSKEDKEKTEPNSKKKSVEGETPTKVKETPAEAPAQEPPEPEKKEEPKQETKEQELAKPDEETIQENKVEEKMKGGEK